MQHALPTPQSSTTAQPLQALQLPFSPWTACDYPHIHSIPTHSSIPSPFYLPNDISPFSHAFGYQASTLLGRMGPSTSTFQHYTGHYIFGFLHILFHTFPPFAHHVLPPHILAFVVTFVVLPCPHLALHYYLQAPLLTLFCALFTVSTPLPPATLRSPSLATRTGML